MRFLAIAAETGLWVLVTVAVGFAVMSFIEGRKW